MDDFGILTASKDGIFGDPVHFLKAVVLATVITALIWFAEQITKPRNPDDE